MDSDDRLVGRLLSRREALVLLGGAGVAFAAACSGKDSASPTQTIRAGVTPSATSTQAAAAAAPSCVVRPELTEGPYFVDEKLERSDIRSDPSDGSVKPGTLLAIAFNVSTVGTGECVPLAGASVDVWHCDALGVYSDAQDPSFATKGQKFLRGYQLTDSSGAAKFTTIYPGWYQGRAVHVHFKIRTPRSGGGIYEFTSQLFFDDALSDRVFAQPPYAQKGQRTTLNSNDGIFRNGGDQLLLAVTPAGADDGYAGAFDIGLQIA